MMFFSSVALYLTVRKASLSKTPPQFINLAMFAIPLAAYSAIGVFESADLGVSWWQALVLLIAGAVFAYGGNKASLQAIDIAPNPGYSLVLSKSYVLFTTIVSVLFLDGELSLRKAIAILIIVGFSVLIMVNPKDAKKTKSEKWVVLSTVAFFAWGLLSLSSKYLFNNDVSAIAFLIYLYTIVTVCILVFDKIRLSEVRQSLPRVQLSLLGIGVFATLFNLGQFEAIKLAPNVGYVNAINAASISLVTLLAVLLFKDELTPKKAIGVAGVTSGLILLLL